MEEISSAWEAKNLYSDLNINYFLKMFLNLIFVLIERVYEYYEYIFEVIVIIIHFVFLKSLNCILIINILGFVI